MKLTVNMTKAKELVHEKRRAKRTQEFAPLDVQATIPSMAEEAEAKRQVIRDKFDAIQTKVDEAIDADELKLALQEIGE